jgi:hypothetical protein
MRHSLLAAVVLAAAVAAALAAQVVAAPRTHTLRRLPPAAPVGQLVVYGHIRSLALAGGRYELRLDPALWLTGVTAARAKLEDTGSADVPNDYYIREEGRRLLTFRVAPAAQVRVLSRTLETITVPVAELARIVRGEKPRRPLFDRQNGLGYWARVDGDVVRSLDQQYQP